MCHYITLIAATSDEAALRTVMQRHGRTARMIDNPSVAAVLRPDERQYLTTVRECDCGTVLADRADPDDGGATEALRLARKGWSKAKIERAMAERRKASARPRAGVDSLALWSDAIGDVLAKLALPRAGLLLHSYSGGIESEAVKSQRRDVAAGNDRQASLATLIEDEAVVFHA